MNKKLLTLLSILFFTATAFASTQPIDRVVAVVNNEVITQNQLNHAYNTAVQQSRQQNISMPNESTAKNEILNQMIYGKLQLQLAERNHFNVTDAQINQAISNIAKQHNVSVATLKQKVQEEGSSYANYRKEIKKQILMSMIQHQALEKNIEVSHSEINQFLEKTKNTSATQYHVIDILVPLPSAPTATQEKQARVEALQIEKSLRQGADVNSIKGANANDLGWRATTDLPDIFLKSLSTMKPGDVTAPIRAPNGYHILKLIEIKKDAAKLPNRAEAKRILLEQKFQKALRKWLVHLREQSYVKIINPQ